MAGGYMGRILDVDLTTGQWETRELSDEDRRHYLGNKILGARLLHQLLAPGKDALTPDNVMIVTTGPLTGSGSPTSARFNMSAKSPLTGATGSSNSGGDFGAQLKRCGYDALIVRGRASELCALHIDEKTVQIEDARSLRGAETNAARSAVPAGAGSMVIGPAGENLVRFACIMSGDRCLGRTGMGAVMGSKNLKIVTARGSLKVPRHDDKGFREHIKAWSQMLRAHPVTGHTLPKYGTASLVRKTNATFTFPTRNFRFGRYEDAENLSGERLAETRLLKNKGCNLCPIQCGRVVELDGKAIKGPEFETIGMFGPHILNNSMARIIEWNDLMDRLGLDTITMGGTIGFAMELAEKGLLKSDLCFGRTDNIAQTIIDTAYRRGIGAELAEGVRELSRRYGGADYAIHSKGLELAAYEPRGAMAQGVGYATANRGGCHLNAGYPIFLEAVGDTTVNALTPLGKPALAVLQQNLFEAISAGGSCLFTAYAVLPGAVSSLNRFPWLKWTIGEAAKAARFILNYQTCIIPLAKFYLPVVPHAKAIELLTGMKMTFADFIKIGERGYNLERLFNLREGLTGADDTLPKRLTDEQPPAGDKRRPVPLNTMVPEYYRIRGWDRHGVPTDHTLTRLDLQWAAERQR